MIKGRKVVDNIQEHRNLPPLRIKYCISLLSSEVAEARKKGAIFITVQPFWSVKELSSNVFIAEVSRIKFDPYTAYWYLY